MSGVHENLPRRCEHGVFKPTDVRDSEPNPVCSICTPCTARAMTKAEYKQLKFENSMQQ